MHVKAFDYLRVLAETGSLRGAAQKIGITPTALTRQLEHLEYFFRTPLFEREQHGVRLTAAGEVVMESAGRVSRELAISHRRVEDLKGLRRGTVRIRASGSTLTSVIAPALDALHRDYPGLRFVIEMSGAPQIASALLSGEADLGLTLFAPDLSELTLCARLPVVHSAIMSPTHPLRNNTNISLHDLRDQSLSLPDAGYFVRQAFDRVIRPGEPDFDPVFMSGSFDLQIDLAMRGCAVLLLPEFTCRPLIDRGLLCAVPLPARLRVPTALDLLRASHRPLSHAARVTSARIGEIMARLT
ncbi:LysR family transcriptional regulator [Acetobacter oeni]|uniref:LysR family transcriptional regulator n=1 Tax=Acetobacter oeni TaxID=304077 RepID=A0A511XJC2_9PROT|nr:LysR family transcriptional regulator [Acetobacter oeni]MBB3882785.1 DNA-binding transcriptional LysR family regulator [Acetobacter oeni]NHO18876.1 LysR family transcriptional regulator [Acetobacter oeni]GBR06378.1 LysR family transcriptional regulator [Acetobacter oeni LMG 21952]GEN63028.1 LysR family transcriptional regulator [Acetobacter oeni]